jgi:MinD superfamily P-loop ATPase
VCEWFCPEKAIAFNPAVNGKWYVSQTKYGIMMHAKLGIAEENSGKLVSTVREKSRKIAEEQNQDLILTDGSPGIGCPVIASLTGADLALIVTEPTVSGIHDLERVAQLVKHFGLAGAVCINKWDLNPEVSSEIEQLAGKLDFVMAGKIRYDRAVTMAQINQQSVVEYQHAGCSEDVRFVWNVIYQTLTASKSGQ